tara:strand:- start:31 stop:186 length:156 start_codon:yes stop_codon:yes gene_type:complete
MIWLIGVIFILQASFYLIFRPAIDFATPVFEFRALLLFLFLIGAWLLSGKD